MSRRLSEFRGTLTAIALLLGLWLIGFAISPHRGELGPRRLFNSGNPLVGWGSRLERACRKVPEVHQLLWPLPIFA